MVCRGEYNRPNCIVRELIAKNKKSSSENVKNGTQKF